MKMTRAEKRRRRTAKLVEMKLDGMDTRGLSNMSFDDLYRWHKNWIAKITMDDFYGTSVADMVLKEKARQLQFQVDKAVLEELTNGKPS